MMESQYEAREVWVEEELVQAESQDDTFTTFLAKYWPALLAAITGLVAVVAFGVYRRRRRQRSLARLPENIVDLAETAIAQGRRTVRREADGRITTRLLRAVPKTELPQLDVRQPAKLLGVKRTEPRGFARVGARLERARGGIGRLLPIATPGQTTGPAPRRPRRDTGSSAAPPPETAGSPEAPPRRSAAPAVEAAA